MSVRRGMGRWYVKWGGLAKDCGMKGANVLYLLLPAINANDAQSAGYCLKVMHYVVIAQLPSFKNLRPNTM